MRPERLRLLAPLLLGGLAAYAQVTTAQHNNARTGANTRETRLTPRNVNSRQFGKLTSLKVDGNVHAQPLYLPDVEIPGKGKHNVVYVATQHNSVYAFDADGRSSEPLWQVGFVNRIAGVTSIPVEDVSRPCTSPEVGITSTPVIDYATGTLYVLVRTKERKNVFDHEYVQRLHALAVTTGAEKLGGPVVVRASVPGHGAQGRVEFDPLRQNQRAALLLDHGTVYIAWSSHCGAGPYHGWVMAYDAQTLAQKAAFNVTPEAEGGGIWLGGAGPAADQDGNVFVATGNGKFDAASGGRNYGDSVLKLRLEEKGFAVRDFFTPYNQEELDINDEDLGAGGPVLLQSPAGASSADLLVVEGKGGTLYVINRDHMGKFHASDDSHAVQTFPTEFSAAGAVAAWNGKVYRVSGNDVLRTYVVERGKLSPGPVSKNKFRRPGVTPSISANGDRDGIVWVVDWSGSRPDEPPAVLRAYDAASVATELYNSEQNSARDRLTKTVRFAIPTVANGHVYVGAARALDIYGLLPAKDKP